MDVGLWVVGCGWYITMGYLKLTRCPQPTNNKPQTTNHQLKKY